MFSLPVKWINLLAKRTNVGAKKTRLVGEELEPRCLLNAPGKSQHTIGILKPEIVGRLPRIG